MSTDSIFNNRKKLFNRYFVTIASSSIRLELTTLSNDLPNQSIPNSLVLFSIAAEVAFLLVDLNQVI